MSKQSALTGYLKQYAQAHQLPEDLMQQWQDVIIVPICGEADDCLTQLVAAVVSDPFLIIVCINRPENNDETLKWQRQNNQFLDHIISTANQVTRVAEQTDGFLCEFDRYTIWVLNYNDQPFADNQGVGLARKIASDTALRLIQQGHIENTWIHSTDADAILPADYFNATIGLKNTAAISLAFCHFSKSKELSAWQSLYDFKLHYYRQGVKFTGAEYDYIPLGSCLIIDADAYAKVRGFPRKSGGEDFYIVNKLAKTGAIAQPDKPLISIRSRLSNRVPFGTGPAIRKMVEQQHQPMFYHPEVFLELQHWRQSLLDYFQTKELPINERLNQFWNISTVLNKAQKQSNSWQRWQQFIHEWFDAFKILKSVHCLETDYPRLPLLELRKLKLFRKLVEGLDVPE